MIVLILLFLVWPTLAIAPFIPDKNPFTTDCYLVMSEIKMPSQFSTLEPYEFLELAQVCGMKPRSWRPPSIASFTLLMIRVKTNTIVLDCILSGYMERSGTKKDTTPFYVVGSTRTPKKVAGMETNCAKASDFPDITDPTESFLYVLLHSKAPNYFNDLRLQRTEGSIIQSKNVDGYARKRILNARQDMLWFGTRRPTTVPEAVQKLQSEYVTENIRQTFLEISTDKLNMGTSFIRCSSSKYGFEPSSFKVSLKSTPMEENLCDTGLPIIPPAADTISTSLTVTLNQPALAPSAPLFPIVLPSPTTEDNSAFQAWITDIQRHHSHSIDVDRISSPEVKSWFEYLQGRQPSQSAYRCRKCNHVISTGLVVEREHGSNRDRLMAPEGSIIMTPPGSSSKSVKKRNNDLIESHMKNPVHLVAEHFFEAVSKSQSEQQIKEKLLEKNSPFRVYYRPTENIHRAVIAGIYMRIPFAQFKTYTRLLDDLEVDTGDHFKNESGMKSIVVSLGNTIHTLLLNYLKQNQDIVLSIIADSSTDLTMEDHLSIRIQFADSQLRVLNLQYGFIKLGDDHAGRTLFELLTKRFEDDGMAEYMRGHIGGMTTDGGPNFLATFVDAVKEFSSRKVFANHCLAHRLELALNHAFSKSDYFKHLDSTINRLYSFYHASSLCGAHLDALRLEESEPRFHLQRLYPVRWIASRKRVSRTILRYYGTIARDLQNIIGENKMDRRRVVEADEIHAEITDRTFVSTLMFLADVSEIFSKLSEDLQYRVKSLIGTKMRRKKLVEELVKIRNWGEGKMSMKTADYMECDGRSCTSWSQFETAESVKLRNVPLLYSSQRDRAQTPKVSVSIDKYIRDIVTEFPTIFVERIHGDFDLFEPSLLTKFVTSTNGPEETTDEAAEDDEVRVEFPDLDSEEHEFEEEMLELIEDDANWTLEDRWLRINRYFGLITPPNPATSSQLAAQYRTLVASVISHPSFGTLKSLRAEEFWAKFATFTGIKWTDQIKLTVRYFLSIPATSASCESSFSNYNKLKTKFRSSLNVETVEAMMRIRDNISPDAKDEEIIYYAREWTKLHFRSGERKKPEVVPSSSDVSSVEYRYPFAPSFFSPRMLPGDAASTPSRRS